MTEPIEPADQAAPPTRPVRVGPNPSWDPDVRLRVQMALNAVTFEMRDILRRYAPKGQYEAPNEVAELGDVSGLMASGRTQVLDRLQARIDEARRVMSEVRDQLDEYKGITWRPPNDPYAWPREGSDAQQT